MERITLKAIPDIPLIGEGDDLAAIIVDRARMARIDFRSGDVVVVTQKIVSKAEGLTVDLSRVVPSPRAEALAAETGKNPRLLEVILRETRRVLRQRPGLVITENHQGWICANAGVDRSNIAPTDGGAVLPLPQDPDRSANDLRDRLLSLTGADVAVIISDTQGRPFRLGAVGVAVGVGGMNPIRDFRGCRDLYGRQLKSTMVAVADELAAAASLLMGQSDEGRPVVLIRGASFDPGEGRAQALQRPREQDLFR